MMPILVLGASGVLGSAVVREGLRRNLEVHGVLRPHSRSERLAGCEESMILHRQDLGDLPELTALLDHLAPRIVVQAAFPVIERPRSMETRWQLLQQALRGTLNVLEAMRLTGFDGHLVLLGSAMTYGPSDTPHRTSDPLQPSTFRGAVKGAESLLAGQYAREMQCAVTELRVFTAYGPWEQRRRLLPSLFAAALSGAKVRLTAESHLRDWIYVDDIARACLQAGERETHEPAVFNVCSGQVHGTHEIAQLAEKVTGCTLVASEPYPGEDHYGDPCPRGVPPQPEDDFDWQPEIDLESGLRKQWAWAQTETGYRYLLSKVRRVKMRQRAQ